MNRENVFDAYYLLLEEADHRVRDGRMTLDQLADFHTAVAFLDPIYNPDNEDDNTETIYEPYGGDDDMEWDEEEGSDTETIYEEDWEDEDAPLIPPSPGAPPPSPVAIVIPDDSDVKEEDCCPICLDNTPGYHVAPRCGHTFHEACLNDVIRTSRSVDVPCPMCRAPIYRHQTT